MTIEFVQEEILPDEKKEVPPTCEELLARVIDLPHRSGSIHVDAPASSLSPYKPKKTEVKEENKEEDKEKKA